MEERYVLVTEDKFSEPMPKEEAIRKLKSYDNQDIMAYVISEKEAQKMKANKEFNTLKWE